MELRLNLVFLGLVMASGAAMTASEPYAALDPKAGATRRLGQLEDAFAQTPADVPCLLELTAAYLEQERPELVISSIGRAAPSARESPEVAHRLARAFESLGRFADARAAADRAFESCLRVLETDGCGPHRLAIFDIHRLALARILSMGVDDPTDPRIRTAYDLVLRRASVRIGGG
jgi:hypothetical protein